MSAPTKLVPPVGRPKPPNAGKGRPKGIPNKITRDQRAALAYAFEGLGGADGLTAWARSNPDAFYQLWGRTVPKDVSVTQGGAVEIRVTYEAPGAADRGDG